MIQSVTKCWIGYYNLTYFLLKLTNYCVKQVKRSRILSFRLTHFVWTILYLYDNFTTIQHYCYQIRVRTFIITLLLLTESHYEIKHTKRNAIAKRESIKNKFWKRSKSSSSAWAAIYLVYLKVEIVNRYVIKTVHNLVISFGVLLNGFQVFKYTTLRVRSLKVKTLRMCSGL